MRKKLQLVASFGLLACSTIGFAQTRYLNEVFTNVTVTSDVIYGNNISVLTGTPMAADITMDVYQPTGDTETARPLVLVLHTGSFLPAVANGQPTGKKTDSAVVEMCMRFAKKGYVAVAPDYRLGWNPISTVQETRTGTLLQAVYRSIQDAKNCVRYFKNDKATTNAYKIDTNRIVVGGLGSGGYIALAYASLNDPSELTLLKFINNTTSPPQPYVIPSIHGNFDGTDSTGYMGATMNKPNYANHTSDIQMVFNVGGAVGDLSWIDTNEVPIVSFHCTMDPNAPYTTGAVIVPSTGDFVVEASGSYDVIERVHLDSINNNWIFNNSLFNDVYTTHANTLNDGMEGLYPFVTPAPGANLSCTGANQNAQTQQGAPWDWWNEADYAAAPGHPNGVPGSVMACLAKTGNPDMSAAKGRMYIDTIQGYVAPRMVCALNLPGCTPNPSGIKEKANAANVIAFPNPATDAVHFSSKGANIQSVELFDLTGRMVIKAAGLNVAEYTVELNGLTAGVYVAKIKSDKGAVATKRVVVK
ncbi:MAG: T9SS type A sorting domain-containing protein [Bacteroidia bacterium]